MKKIFVMLLGVFLLFGVGACSSKVNDANKDKVIQAYVDLNNNMIKKSTYNLDIVADLGIKKSSIIPADINAKLNTSLAFNHNDGILYANGSLVSSELIPMLRSYTGDTSSSQDTIKYAMGIDKSNIYFMIDGKWFKEAMSAEEAKQYQSGLNTEQKQATKEETIKVFDSLSNTKYEETSNSYVITATLDYSGLEKMSKNLPTGETIDTDALAGLKSEDFKMSMEIIIPKDTTKLEEQVVLKDIKLKTLGNNSLGTITIKITANDNKVTLPADTKNASDSSLLSD
ncbi:MAG: hypothetical protein LBR40_00235 [Bacilli bacterium]|jgi:hypothetical protein|nr:hypothetical protein [Bacilli bacterium]